MPELKQYRWPREYNVIPQDVFFREDVYQLELQRVFGGEDWHPVAHRAEIPKPGDFKLATIGEAPLLVVHSDDGAIRVFYNSCAHRGTQLKICPRGKATEIECPYHRWLFNLRGELVGAPGISDFSPSFKKADFGLRELRSGEVSGLVLATKSVAGISLDDFLGEAKNFIALVMGSEPLALLGYHKVAYSGNWKEYGDNEG